MFSIRLLFLLFLLTSVGIFSYLLGKVHAIKSIEKVHYEQSKKMRLQNCRLELANGFIEMWLKGKTLLSFFQENNVNRIAIYGYGLQGKVLEKEILTAGKEIVCIVDQNANNIKCNYKVYSLDQDLPEFDMLVVTAAGVERRDIYKKLKNKECEVVLVRDIYAL